VFPPTHRTQVIPRGTPLKGKQRRCTRGGERAIALERVESTALHIGVIPTKLKGSGSFPWNRIREDWGGPPVTLQPAEDLVWREVNPRRKSGCERWKPKRGRSGSDFSIRAEILYRKRERIPWKKVEKESLYGGKGGNQCKSKTNRGKIAVFGMKPRRKKGANNRALPLK